MAARSRTTRDHHLILDSAVYHRLSEGRHLLGILPPPTTCPTAITGGRAVGVLDVDRDGWLDLVYEVNAPVPECVDHHTVGIALQTGLGQWEAHSLIDGPIARHYVGYVAAMWDRPGGRLTLDTLGDTLGPDDPYGLYLERGRVVELAEELAPLVKPDRPGRARARR